MQHLLREAQVEITRLQMLIAVLLRNRFGRRSERLGEAALQQGVEDIEQSLGEQKAKIEAGGVSPNPRKFRQVRFSPATIASRSITWPPSRKV